MVSIVYRVVVVLVLVLVAMSNATSQHTQIPCLFPLPMKTMRIMRQRLSAPHVICALPPQRCCHMCEHHVCESRVACVVHVCVSVSAVGLVGIT